jgi:exonuclease SbcC
MIPVHLRISGFLSYREPVELDFTTFELACISGHNGAGKSSLLDAMTWALFGQARKRDDSIINTAALVSGKAAEVALDFRYEDNLYRIQRSKAKDKPTLLEFFVWRAGEDGGEGIWKPLTEKSVRETEARIQSTLRMDYETFINASFFLQGKADQFAQQRPGDRKRILASILGLDAWEEYRERAVEQRNALEVQVGSLDGQLREIDSELAEGPQRKARLAELKTRLKDLRAAREQQSKLLDSLKKIEAMLEHQREQVEGLERQLRAAGASRDSTRARLAERLSERQRYSAEVAQAETIRAEYANWQAARESLRQWDEVAQRYQHEQPRRQPLLLQIEAEKARLEQEARQLAAQAQEAAGLEANLPGLRADFVRAQQAVSEASARLQRREQLQQQRLDIRQMQLELDTAEERCRAALEATTG